MLERTEYRDETDAACRCALLVLFEGPCHAKLATLSVCFKVSLGPYYI